MKKLVSIFLTVVAAAALLCGTAYAFDANDYDYSYSDYDSGSSWDSDDDYYSGSSYYDGDSGSSGGSFSTGLAVIIIVIVVLMIAYKNKAAGSGTGGANQTGGVRPANGGQGRNVTVPDRTAQIEQIIKADDPNFTADDFMSFAKQVYMDIQTAWCKRDLTSVRPVMHNNLYNTTQRQVQSKIDQKVVYHYESITINTAYLTSYVRDEQFEYLTVYLNSRFIDYQTNEETGVIIRGDKTTRWDFRYKMKFIRTVGVKTREAGETDLGHNCPNCGAPLEMSSSGKCAYCGSTVTSDLYSWILSDFTTVRDDTKDDGIRINSDNGGGNG